MADGEPGNTIYLTMINGQMYKLLITCHDGPK